MHDPKPASAGKGPLINHEDLRKAHMDNLAICMNRNFQVIKSWLASHTSSQDQPSADDITKITQSLDIMLSMRSNLDYLMNPQSGPTTHAQEPFFHAQYPLKGTHPAA